MNGAARHVPCLRLAVLLAGVSAALGAYAAPVPGGAKPAAAAAPKAPAAAPTRYRPDPFAGQAGRYYRLIWGVDALSVKWVESGEIVRFSWRVLDASKAAVLNDVRVAPALVDPKEGVSLVVPSMDMVGLLRQHSAPEDGKTYWMAFSNKGRVKRGDRVDVVIGSFRADGLVVE